MLHLYYGPEAFGLKIVGEVDWLEAPYEFDLTVVWKDKAGTLYWGWDSGCSCNTPFDDFGLDDLRTGNFHALSRELTEGVVSTYSPDRAREQVTDLLSKLVLQEGK